MCWQSKKLEARVSNGVFVYKAMKPESSLGISARPKFYDMFLYKRNKINPRVMIMADKSYNGEMYKIYYGYHSYLNIPDVVDIGFRCDIYKMEIPKGTIYYVDNETCTVVSENIIMRERLSYNHKMRIPLYARIIHFFYDLFT